LDQLIERAFAANTNLRVALANLTRARAVFTQSRGARLPFAEGSGGAGVGGAAFGGLVAGPSGQNWSAQSALSVGWEADLFGRVGRTIESSRADAQAVEAAADMVRVAVAAETARSYADACGYAAAGETARESLAAVNESLRVVRAQESAGTVSRFDLERAELAAATAAAAIPPLETRRQAALYELAALIGEVPANVPAGAQKCTVAPSPTGPFPIGDGSSLLRRRPDLREAERRLAADTARIGVATADLYPRISFAGGGNSFRGDGLSGSSSTFSLGPLLSWSFPNIPAARARIAQAEAQSAASVAAFEGRVLAALKEVEQALTTYHNEIGRHDLLAAARRRAESAYRLADANYRAGAISYLDLLVAQRELLDARASVAASSQLLGSLRIDLFKALGGGWGSAL
jgi:NodT family efflux transporter outer membrane factor (OMF) lipoprotein